MMNKRPKAIEEPPKEPPKAIELPPPPKEPELQAVSPGNGKTDRNSDGHSLLYIKLNFPLLDCLSVRLTLKSPYIYANITMDIILYFSKCIKFEI